MKQTQPSFSESEKHERQSQSLLRIWFGVTGEVPRKIYAVSGVTLMLLKYLTEAGVIYAFTGKVLTPWNFLNPLVESRNEILAGAPGWLAWGIFLWSFPFVWIAFSMSVRRAADAGQSPWLGTLVLVPVLNLVVMLFLALAPGDAASEWGSKSSSESEKPLPPLQRHLLAIAAGLCCGLVMLILSVYIFDSYGATLFFATPLMMGACAGFIYNRPEPGSMSGTLSVATLLMLAAGGVLLLFAFEGLICLVMAAPLVFPLGWIGAALGKAIADKTNTSIRQTLLVLCALPVLAGAESVYQTAPEYVVLTSVEIDAPPETVWRYVTEFPDLSEPDEWFFRVGIACPLRARIEGQGVGATRYCEFTTGTFVEPITVWDKPRRLAFNVTDQPDPMIELSPYRHVHPPHLSHQSLRSRRGEFRLIALPGGRTRLEGRTWYTFEMFPQQYWTLWSQGSIHRIHLRVLNHIKQLSEADRN
ncbi:MAG: hypothetical protein Tsb009_12830 [Planctomycetaceae bacterium]